MDLNKIKHYLAFIPILILLSLFPLFAANNKGCLLDDAYITHTYARSLANNEGFVFNYPPPTFGTTTPLLTVTIALLAKILPGLDVSKIAVFFSACCWAAIPWGIFFFSDSFQLQKWQACIIGAVIIGSGSIELLGMEMYLFAFLLILTVAVFIGGHFFLSGIGCGLLFLTRGEGVLILAVFIIWLLLGAFKKTQGSFRAIALYPTLYLCIAFIITILPWFVFAYNTFGHFLPNTLGAKMAQMRSGQFSSFYSHLLFWWLPELGADFTLPKIPFLNLWWFLVCLGLLAAVILKRRWLIFLLWIILYTLGYTVLNVPGSPWYLFPIAFVMQLFVSLGLVYCVQLCLKFRKPFFIGRLLAIILFCCFFAVIFKPTLKAALSGCRSPKADGYLNLAHWFVKNAKPSESVAYFEIGYIGYFTRNRIVDLAGLTLPGMIPYVMKGDYAGGFWQYAPDYYIHTKVSNNLVGQLITTPRFINTYKPVAEFPFLPLFGGKLTIYKRMKKTGEIQTSSGT
jgi:hypothetical protein